MHQSCTKWTGACMDLTKALEWDIGTATQCVLSLLFPFIHDPFRVECVWVGMANYRFFSRDFLIVFTKGQLISKANFKVFIWTKNQRKYFLISVLASKSGQIKKISDKYMINSIKLVFQCFYLLFQTLFKGFLKLRQKYKNIFVGFWFKWKL